MARDEILTKLTFYIRGDRFCEGLLAELIENGIIKNLIRCLHERTK